MDDRATAQLISGELDDERCRLRVVAVADPPRPHSHVDQIRPAETTRSIRVDRHSRSASAVRAPRPTARRQRPRYWAVRSSPGTRPPRTNATAGFARRLRALRDDPSVSNTISKRSVTAIPTTAACAPPSGAVDASTATRCERRKPRSAAAVMNAGCGRCATPCGVPARDREAPPAQFVGNRRWNRAAAAVPRVGHVPADTSLEGGRPRHDVRRVPARVHDPTPPSKPMCLSTSPPFHGRTARCVRDVSLQRDAARRARSPPAGRPPAPAEPSPRPAPPTPACGDGRWRRRPPPSSPP